MSQVSIIKRLVSGDSMNKDELKEAQWAIQTMLCYYLAIAQT